MDETTEILILKARVGLLEMIIDDFETSMCARCGVGSDGWPVSIKAALTKYNKIYGKP